MGRFLLGKEEDMELTTFIVIMIAILVAIGVFSRRRRKD
ncbi:LPXTG cell wall anchor domain-containing protein [Shinella sp. CPCC 100929]|uniref:LPXTG cell wall anchor domain-containing protein n=1 Tax=Shinella lacus TaxID=2654216 RepID=A0ABT1R5X4_9HYPH|nr:LPXTG cell wall anchor domain-containing protein [Shinella lacus]